MSLSIKQCVDFLLENRKYIEPGQLDALRSLCNLPIGTSDAVDMRDEVEQQLLLVKGMRERMLERNRSEPNKFDTREFKDLVASSTTLLSMLTKMHDQILNQSRVKALSAALHAAIKDLEPGRQQIFTDHLREILEELP